jgi:hypothetical protein
MTTIDHEPKPVWSEIKRTVESGRSRQGLGEVALTIPGTDSGPPTENEDKAALDSD